MSSAVAQRNMSVRSERLSEAKLYYDSACQCLSNKELLPALNKFIKTAELVESLPEDMNDEELHLTARSYYQMGNVFVEMSNNAYQIETFLRASQYQNIRQDTAWRLYTKVALASSHLLVNNLDSVDYYLDQIKPLTDSTKFPYEYYRTLHIISKNYYEKKEYDTAFYLMKKLINFQIKHGKSAIGDSIMMGITMFHSPYKYQSKPYLLKMFETPPDYWGNLGLPAVLLAELYEEEGNDDSLNICNKYMPQFVNDLAGVESDNITAKLMYEQFKTERDKRLNELKIQKERKKYRDVAISIIFAILLLSAFVIIMVKKRKKSPHNDASKFDEAWKSLEQNELLQHIRVKLLTDNGEKITVKNIDKYSDRSINNIDFIKLQHQIDKTFDGVISRLSEQYPDLGPIDIYCCCMSIVGLTNSEMAVLLGVKYNAVSNRISKIKNIFNTEKNLREFMIKYYCEME